MAGVPDPSWGGPGLGASQLVRLSGIPGIPAYVRREVAPLHQWLIPELKKARKSGAPELSSSGGYNKRKVAGTSVWSRHSWGLAMDWNAGTNPYKTGPLVTDFEPAKIRAACAHIGFRWGGDYSVKKDSMHVEAMGSVASVARTVARLGKIPSGCYGVGSSGTKVLEVEILLTLLGLGTGKLDGIFDEDTKTAVVVFQRLTGLAQDGIVGPDTLTALDHIALPLEQSPRDYHRGSVLEPGDELWPGEIMASPDGSTQLSMQRDGNLVAYRDGKPVWSTSVRGNLFAMQGDGNAVMYAKAQDRQTPQFASGTTVRDSILQVQDDGNVVIYGPDSKPLWATDTYRR